MSRPSLDWSDLIAVSRWLAGLRLAFNDADGITRDMLRAPRDRELGPVLHAQNYEEARTKIVQAIDYASAPEPENGDPSGNGGAGPLH